MTLSMIICAVLITFGFIFMVASLIGIARFPDFFARLHAQGVGDTLGAFLILAGMMAAAGGLLAVKILLIFIIIVLTNPLGTNLMMIAAINKEDYHGYRSFMTGREAPGEHPQETGSEIAAAKEESEAKAASEAGSEPESEPASETGSKPEPEAEPEPESETGSKPEPEAEPEPETKTADNIEKENRPEKEKTSGKKKKGRSAGRRKPSMNMNKAELLKAAEERGVEVPEGATKREILGLIYSVNDRKYDR